MIRLTWVQSRTQNMVTAGLLAATAAFLIATGPHLAHLYNETVAGCSAHGDCDAARDAFLRNDPLLRAWLDTLVVVIPALIGIFWGAPLVAREFEAGTHRFVWTQSVSRTRWFATKLLMLGVAGVAVAGLLSLVVTWWAGPLDHAHMSRFGTFDQRDVVPVGYAAFAFALAVVAGILVRRTLPAIVVAIAGFVAARLAVWHWVRPHLATATHAVLPISAAHRVGFVPGTHGAQLVVGDASINNAWILSSKLVDRTGHPVSDASLHHFLQTTCPVIAERVSHLGPGIAPPNPEVFHQCITSIAATFRLSLTYQPSGHYWQLQWLELAIFLAAAAALGAFAFRMLRTRSG